MYLAVRQTVTGNTMYIQHQGTNQSLLAHLFTQAGRATVRAVRAVVACVTVAGRCHQPLLVTVHAAQTRLTVAVVGSCGDVVERTTWARELVRV